MRTEDVSAKRLDGLIESLTLLVLSSVPHGGHSEQFTHILKEIHAMSAELTRLTQEVAEMKGAVDSATALIEGLAQFIRDHSEDPAALTKFADDLDAQQSKIAAAVAANPIPAPPTP